MIIYLERMAKKEFSTMIHNLLYAILLIACTIKTTPRK